MKPCDPATKKPEEPRKPRAIFNDPFRGFPHVMVLADAWQAVFHTCGPCSCFVDLNQGLGTFSSPFKELDRSPPNPLSFQDIDKHVNRAKGFARDLQP